MKIRTFALLALMLLCAPVHSQAQTKIKVGYLPSHDFDLLYTAQEKGIFAKHGLDVTMYKLVVSSNIPPSLMSGSIDIGYASPMTLLLTNENGLDLVAIGGAVEESKAEPNMGLVARTDTGIKTAQDLKGKKVAVTGINNAMHVMLIQWLIDRGVDPSSVQMIEVPLMQMTDVMRGKQIDAGTFVEPLLSRAVSTKAGYLLSSYVADVQDKALLSLWVTQRKWAQEHPQVVAAYRASMKDAYDYLQKHPEEIGDIEVKYMKYKSPVPAHFVLDVKPSHFDIWIKVGLKTKVLRHPPDPKSLIFN